MRRVGEYKQHAKDCRALAARTMRPDDKVILEEIVKAWDKVATLREWDLEEALTSRLIAREQLGC